MTQTGPSSTGPLWARFRFSVVGSLLSSPPAPGALKTAIRSLAAKTWSHPVTGCPVQFSAVSIERWYYKARRERDDPVGVLRRAVRKDSGKISLAAAIAERLIHQYREHQDWSYQLHYDNLAALVHADPSLASLPSYSTVRRYMHAHGLARKPRRQPRDRPGEARAEMRRETREIRSYEAEYVGSLWHLDFHHSSLKILTPGGVWLRPIVESRCGAVVLGLAYRFPALSVAGASLASPCSVSTSRSSNRAGGFPAPGFRTRLYFICFFTRSPTNSCRYVRWSWCNPSFWCRYWSWNRFFPCPGTLNFAHNH